MKIRMLRQVRGKVHGKPWPPAGGEVELADHHAAYVCSCGDAVPADGSPAPTVRLVSPAVDMEGILAEMDLEDFGS